MYHTNALKYFVNVRTYRRIVAKNDCTRLKNSLNPEMALQIVTMAITSKGSLPTSSS